MFDLLIRNGNLVDGTGATARRADVAVSGERIAAVDPTIEGDAREVIDASGCIVTPGFVDPHTHYDGQVTWDPVLGPSSWHGVTTVVMGNCGVGFAPAQPERHQWLIELMEGVEDIPGAALAEGIRWDWESFPEYLDAVERMPRAIDVAAQLAHGALRAYVMGDRGAANEDATADDVRKMANAVRDAVAAGAVAFSTNRLPLHTSIRGVPVPGTFADHEELVELARPLRDLGKGILQAIPAGAMGEDPDAPLREIALFRQLSLELGIVINFSLAQMHPYPELWREVLDAVAAANAEGARLVPQVQGRPAGMLMSWDTFNPFRASPSYRHLHTLPRETRLKRLLEPEVRAQILSEVALDSPAMAIMRNSLDTTFALDDGPVYEPDPDASIAALAERAGRPPLELIYDLMCERGVTDADAQPGWLHVLFAGYKGGSLAHIEEMMQHPDTVVGLADGGAHCSMICDASLPTFMLVHWVRGRRRGPRIALEQAVRMLSDEPAQLYGFSDRGRVAPGLRADLNLIDLDNLDLHLPEILHDLPTGAPRVVQRATGYVATLCAGQVTFRNGEYTGATPGRLVRS